MPESKLRCAVKLDCYNNLMVKINHFLSLQPRVTSLPPKVYYPLSFWVYNFAWRKFMTACVPLSYTLGSGLPETPLSVTLSLVCHNCWFDSIHTHCCFVLFV
ncbi:hypothetical protein AMECASPLE_037519 [Ameca splendens]|uniref:Uncharacterized protein n=1 Tax=Ameca splendens TaxID=208324 RepID=A0ABV0XX96_9TELE